MVAEPGAASRDAREASRDARDNAEIPLPPGLGEDGKMEKIDWIVAEMREMKEMLARLLETKVEEASLRMAEVRRDRSEVRKPEREE